MMPGVHREEECSHNREVKSPSQQNDTLVATSQKSVFKTRTQHRPNSSMPRAIKDWNPLPRETGKMEGEKSGDGGGGGGGRGLYGCDTFVSSLRGRINKTALSLCFQLLLSIL